MPLAGTKREQKHYERIRKEYPEKGKEYAARVARNIVRANTPGGRKLKGTTEYGRTWGPPYSEPLSKKSMAMFKEAGQHAAMEKLGLKETTIMSAAKQLLGRGAPKEEVVQRLLRHIPRQRMQREALMRGVPLMSPFEAEQMFGRALL